MGEARSLDDAGVCDAGEEALHAPTLFGGRHRIVQVERHVVVAVVRKLRSGAVGDRGLRAQPGLLQLSPGRGNEPRTVVQHLLDLGHHHRCQLGQYLDGAQVVV